MRLALVFVALLSACTTYSGSKKVARVGGYMMISGASVAAVGGAIGFAAEAGIGHPSTSYELVGLAIGIALIGAVIFTPGAALRIGGLIGTADHDREIAERAAANQRHEQALSLMQEAVASSRSGDCETVGRIRLQLLTIDAEFERMVFRADVPIAQCLAQLARDRQSCIARRIERLQDAAKIGDPRRRSQAQRIIETCK